MKVNKNYRPLLKLNGRFDMFRDNTAELLAADRENFAHKSTFRYSEIVGLLAYADGICFRFSLAHIFHHSA